MCRNVALRGRHIRPYISKSSHGMTISSRSIGPKSFHCPKPIKRASCAKVEPAIDCDFNSEKTVVCDLYARHLLCRADEIAGCRGDNFIPYDRS